MRFHVDAWDPSYGTSVVDTGADTESSARVALDIETAASDWAPLEASAVESPPAVLFVDGVRRIDARVWIEDAAGNAAVPGICASYAAGVVSCCDDGAEVVTAEVRRGLFTASPDAVDVTTSLGSYAVSLTPDGDAEQLSLALQRRLAELEVVTAVQARAALPTDVADRDLLVVDGPLRGRQHLPRALGFIKTHRADYLPPELHALVGQLGPGQRTPVFLMGTTWDRHSWYLRLPCRPGAPWAGVVRVECSADIRPADAVALANLSQSTLCRYASVEYKDPRAPQNLVPIAGLERHLRRRLGDPRVLFRSLQIAAA
jgi:hypothetical protein